jgi:hypothetical protein
LLVHIILGHQRSGMHQNILPMRGFRLIRINSYEGKSMKNYEGQYPAVIISTVEEENLQGFGGSGRYVFTAELRSKDNSIALGKYKIFSMGRPDPISAFIPGKKYILVLTKRTDGFYFERMLDIP